MRRFKVPSQVNYATYLTLPEFPLEPISLRLAELEYRTRMFFFSPAELFFRKTVIIGHFPITFCHFCLCVCYRKSGATRKYSDFFRHHLKGLIYVR